MPPKFTPQAPQVGRYWPGKPIKGDDEASSDEEEEEEMEEEEKEVEEEEFAEKATTRNAVATAKLVTTMKTTNLSKQGPYMELEEEESLVSESEEEVPQPEQRAPKARQARRRAMGDFVAVDQINLEDEEKVHTIFKLSKANV
jgi:hypothetical protein